MYLPTRKPHLQGTNFWIYYSKVVPIDKLKQKSFRVHMVTT